MTIISVNGDTLSDLAINAKAKCGESSVFNLIISGIFPIAEIDSDFVNSFRDQARVWQSPNVPEDMFFTHGKYIDLGKKGGRSHLVDELRAKPDSNRACLSLIHMPDLVDSGDSPIPSFLLTQFSFEKSGVEELHATAYFRAMEVCNFLPINIAEICDIIAHLRQEFPGIVRFNLVIHAFRAYANPSFQCLKKSRLDVLTAIDIAMMVERLEFSELIKLLESKIHTYDSAVCTSGIDFMLEAFTKTKSKYPRGLLDDLRLASDSNHKALQHRLRSSCPQMLAEHRTNIRAPLERVRATLVAMKEGMGS